MADLTPAEQAAAEVLLAQANTRRSILLGLAPAVQPAEVSDAAREVVAAVRPVLLAEWQRIERDAIAAMALPDPHPDCPHEWHGADGGACPACGYDIQGPAPTGGPDSGARRATAEEIARALADESAQWARRAEKRRGNGYHEHAVEATRHAWAYGQAAAIARAHAEPPRKD